MLVHRCGYDITTGDVVYLRALVQFALIHVIVVRYQLCSALDSFGFMAGFIVSGVC